MRLAIPKILKWEGGWADNPKDPGGATMKGITLNTFIGYRLKNNLPKPSKDDLRKISDKEWAEVFKEEYWDEIRADDIRDQSVANIFMDWFWMSWDDAIEAVQTLVGTKPDGDVGNITIKAINAQPGEQLFNRIKAARESFFSSIIKKHPNLETFRHGWMNRLNDYTYQP